MGRRSKVEIPYPAYIKNWLVSWFNDKELSSGTDAIGLKLSKKKKKKKICYYTPNLRLKCTFLFCFSHFPFFFFFFTLTAYLFATSQNFTLFLEKMVIIIKKQMHPQVIICLGIKLLNRFWVEKFTSSMNMALIYVNHVLKWWCKHDF